MDLTYQRGGYLNLVALETYLILVENDVIPLLRTPLRHKFIELLVSTVAYDLDSEESQSNNPSKEYKKKVMEFFESDKKVLKLWRQFSISQAEKDGTLSPERIVEDLLIGVDASYAQKSELQSHAIKFIAKAKKKGYDVASIINSVQFALRRNGAYKRILLTTKGA